MTENKWLMPASVILAGLFIAGAVFWNGQHPASVGSGATAAKYSSNAQWLEHVTKSVDGIDVSKVKAAVTASKSDYDAVIVADKAEGASFGVQATPTSVIGKTLIAGAYPFDRVSLAIDAALAGKKDTGSPALDTAAADSSTVKTDGEPFVGSASAPYTIGFWSDFQCPFCERFETQTLPQIITQYVNTGKVKIVFKDFAFLGPASLEDAEWGRAVWQLYPDKYFAWRSAMFTDQQPENSLPVK